MIKIKYSQFRSLEPAHILIKDIYPAYRSGWNDAESKTKSYIYFPDTVTQDVVFHWDASIDYTDKSSKQHLRLQEWDNDAKKFKFTKVAPPNRDFFKAYKKVFDVDITLNTNCMVQVWDSTAKAMVDYRIDEGEDVRIIALPAKKIQDIASAMMLTKGIEKVDAEVTDRVTGKVTKTKKLPFDWEDSILGSLVGKAFQFTVEGEKLETKYAFAEVKAFEQKVRDNTLVGDIAEGDLPF